MPRSKCPVMRSFIIVRKRESPSCRGRHHASALRSPHSHAQKIGTRISYNPLTVSCFSLTGIGGRGFSWGRRACEHGKLLTEKPVRSQVFSLVSEVVDSVPRLLTLFCSRLRQESRGLSSLISNFEAIRNVCVTRGTRINTRFQTWEYCFNFDFKIGKLHI